MGFTAGLTYIMNFVCERLPHTVDSLTTLIFCSHGHVCIITNCNAMNEILNGH